MKTVSLLMGCFFASLFIHTVFFRAYDDITIFKAIMDIVLAALFFYTSIKKPNSNV